MGYLHFRNPPFLILWYISGAVGTDAPRSQNRRAQMHKPRGPQPFPGLKLPLVGKFWGVDAYHTNTGDAVYRFCMMLLVVLVVLYCGWKKSCTTLDGWNPINNGINYLSTGAGFLPSTVSSLLLCFALFPSLLTECSIGSSHSCWKMGLLVGGPGVYEWHEWVVSMGQTSLVPTDATDWWYPMSIPKRCSKIKS